MKDKLVQLIAIFYGVDPALYEITYEKLKRDHAYYDNHSRVTLKKINADYFNDPLYYAEAYDLEPITIKDGGFFPDEYAGKTIVGYQLREEYNRSHMDRFPRSENKFTFNEISLDRDIKKYKKLLSNIKE